MLPTTTYRIDDAEFQKFLPFLKFPYSVKDKFISFYWGSGDDVSLVEKSDDRIVVYENHSMKRSYVNFLEIIKEYSNGVYAIDTRLKKVVYDYKEKKLKSYFSKHPISYNNNKLFLILTENYREEVKELFLVDSDLDEDLLGLVTLMCISNSMFYTDKIGKWGLNVFKDLVQINNDLQNIRNVRLVDGFINPSLKNEERMNDFSKKGVDILSELLLKSMDDKKCNDEKEAEENAAYLSEIINKGELPEIPDTNTTGEIDVIIDIFPEGIEIISAKIRDRSLFLTVNSDENRWDGDTYEKVIEQLDLDFIVLNFGYEREGGNKNESGA